MRNIRITKLQNLINKTSTALTQLNTEDLSVLERSSLIILLEKVSNAYATDLNDENEKCREDFFSIVQPSINDVNLEKEKSIESLRHVDLRKISDLDFFEYYLNQITDCCAKHINKIKDDNSTNLDDKELENI